MMHKPRGRSVYINGLRLAIELKPRNLIRLVPA
jgi:hypothetical protein